MTADLYEALEEQAYEKGVSPVDIIRRAIENELKH